MSRGSAAAAVFVWTLARTRCPVIAALDAIVAVSPSRISPIRTTSGSCRNTARSARGKIEPDTGVDLDLGDALVELILDRILDGDDIAIGPDDRAQGGVERRRLAGSVGRSSG